MEFNRMMQGAHHVLYLI